MLDLLGRYLSRVYESWKHLADPGPDDVRVQLAFFALLVAVTLLFRGRKSWSVRATLGVLATIIIIHLNMIAWPLIKLIVDAVKSGYDSLGIPRLPASTWTSVPAWVVAVVAAVGHDFANYWNHRLLHTRPFWPIHAIHHSDPDVNGLTTFRAHVLEDFVMSCSFVILLTWLNIPDGAIGILGVILVLHNMYIHADLDWHHGPFELFFASPRYHRWHHADVPEAHGKNLANVMPLFDWLFGTYYCPGTCNAPIGAKGVPEHSPLALFLWPGVAWLRGIRATLSRAPSRAPL